MTLGTGIYQQCSNLVANVGSNGDAHQKCPVGFSQAHAAADLQYELPYKSPAPAPGQLLCLPLMIVGDGGAEIKWRKGNTMVIMYKLQYPSYVTHYNIIAVVIELLSSCINVNFPAGKGY